MNGYSTGLKLALAALAGLAAAGCAGYPTQQAQRWDDQYKACYGDAFGDRTPAASAKGQDAMSLRECLAARGWTSQS
jgi:hypothetical protein